MDAENFGIVAITAADEHDGLVQVLVTTNCRSDTEATVEPDLPWFRLFRIRVRVSTSMQHGHGKLRVSVPRDSLEDSVRAIIRAARDADAAYEVYLDEQRVKAEQVAAELPAKQRRLASDQARIDAVMSE
jgi:hypothetical protein